MRSPSPLTCSTWTESSHPISNGISGCFKKELPLSYRLSRGWGQAPLHSALFHHFPHPRQNCLLTYLCPQQNCKFLRRGALSIFADIPRASSPHTPQCFPGPQAQHHRPLIPLRGNRDPEITTPSTSSSQPPLTWRYLPCCSESHISTLNCPLL